MAIDDNTSYELTGAQVKDLANKIKAKAADNIFVGATSALPGSKGLVPAPQAGDDTKFLSGDGTWKTAGGGGSTYTAGDGIDITSNVISATNTGLAKILTTDDYNWNSTAHDSTTTPFDCVALWLLPEGYYYNKNQVNYVQYSGDSAAVHWKDAFIIGPKGQTYRRILKFDYADNIIRVWTVTENGGSSGGNAGILTSADVINDLVTTSNNKPLSATQGKTLKDLIDSLVVKNAGAPTTSTVGTVGKLYEDTTNGKLYICTDATNPYVWEEVGGSAGPVITMQTTDPGEGQPLAANHFIAVYEP